MIRLPALPFRSIHIHAAPAARVRDARQLEWIEIRGMEFNEVKIGQPFHGEIGDIGKIVAKKQQGQKFLVQVDWGKTKDARNHLGEKEYSTYSGWRAAAKAAGATRFEGDKDIASAHGPNGGVGEWDGEKGSVYTQTQDSAGDIERAKKQLAYAQAALKRTPASNYPVVAMYAQQITLAQAELRKLGVNDADPSSYLGKLVKFKIPSLNGPMKIAGTVKMILPDDRLEVKSQNHGYHKVAISELVE